MTGDFDDIPPDAKDAKPMNGDEFPVLPKGDYEAMATKHEIKSKPENGGKFHAFTFQVISGPHINAKLFSNFCFFHPDAQKRARQAGLFAAFKAAIGETRKEGFKGSELLQRPLKLSIEVFADKQTGEQRNYVNAYHPRHIGGTVQPASTSGYQGAAPNNQPATVGAGGVSNPFSSQA